MKSLNHSLINFVLCGDKKYVKPLGVTITSILLNLNKNSYPRFFIFESGFDEHDIKILKKVQKVRKCEINIIDIEQYNFLFQNIDTSTSNLANYISVATYYRLLMLKFLPDDVDKCFYIDGDMIVDTDLYTVYNEFDSNKLLASVVEIYAMQFREEILKKHFRMQPFYKFAKEPFKYPYFNAGFFLLNVKMAKEEHLFNKAVNFLKNYPNPPYVDQDVLNAIIGQEYTDRISYLDPSYNVFCQPDLNIEYNNAFYSQDVIKKALKNPKIYHFGGANKPWINCFIPNYYSVWWKYCKKSPYKTLKQPIEYRVINFYLFNFIKILTLKKYPLKDKYYFLGFIPCYRISKNNTRNVHYLFSVLPYLLVK